MSFPALCLHVLPQPPTLFSTVPFPSNDSWTLRPPGATQLDSLKKTLRNKIQDHPTRIADAEVVRLQSHLYEAWSQWSQNSEGQRSEAWQLEVLRAYAGASKRIQEKDEELEKAKQQIEHLRQQYDRLSRCQLPRDLLLHPPNTLPMSTKVAQELSQGDPDSRAWDYDRLIWKWRGTMRDVATRGPAGLSEKLGNHRPSNAQQHSPGTSGQSRVQAPPHPSSLLNQRSSMPDGHANGLKDDEEEEEEEEDDEDQDADADADEDADADADADAEGEDVTPSIAQHSWSGSQRIPPPPQQSSVPYQNPYHQTITSAPPVVNENGKRPSAQSPRAHRSKGAKIYHSGP